MDATPMPATKAITACIRDARLANSLLDGLPSIPGKSVEQMCVCMWLIDTITKVHSREPVIYRAVSDLSTTLVCAAKEGSDDGRQVLLTVVLKSMPSTGTSLVHHVTMALRAMAASQLSPTALKNTTATTTAQMLRALAEVVDTSDGAHTNNTRLLAGWLLQALQAAGIPLCEVLEERVLSAVQPATLLAAAKAELLKASSEDFNSTLAALLPLPLGAKGACVLACTVTTQLYQRGKHAFAKSARPVLQKMLDAVAWDPSEHLPAALLPLCWLGPRYADIDRCAQLAADALASATPNPSVVRYACMATQLEEQSSSERPFIYALACKYGRGGNSIAVITDPLTWVNVMNLLQSIGSAAAASRPKTTYMAARKALLSAQPQAAQELFRKHTAVQWAELVAEGKTHALHFLCLSPFSTPALLEEARRDAAKCVLAHARGWGLSLGHVEALAAVSLLDQNKLRSSEAQPSSQQPSSEPQHALAPLAKQALECCAFLHVKCDASVRDGFNLLCRADDALTHTELRGRMVAALSDVYPGEHAARLEEVHRLGADLPAAAATAALTGRPVTCADRYILCAYVACLRANSMSPIAGMSEKRVAKLRRHAERLGRSPSSDQWQAAQLAGCVLLLARAGHADEALLRLPRLTSADLRVAVVARACSLVQGCAPPPPKPQPPSNLSAMKFLWDDCPAEVKERLWGQAPWLLELLQESLYGSVDPEDGSEMATQVKDELTEELNEALQLRAAALWGFNDWEAQTLVRWLVLHGDPADAWLRDALARPGWEPDAVLRLAGRHVMRHRSCRLLASKGVLEAGSQRPESLYRLLPEVLAEALHDERPWDLAALAPVLAGLLLQAPATYNMVEAAGACMLREGGRGPLWSELARDPDALAALLEREPEHGPRLLYLMWRASGFPAMQRLLTPAAAARLLQLCGERPEEEADPTMLVLAVAASPPPPEHVCACCGGLGGLGEPKPGHAGRPKLPRCGCPMQLRYCGPECQAAHWHARHGRQCMLRRCAGCGVSVLGGVACVKLNSGCYVCGAACKAIVLRRA